MSDIENVIFNFIKKNYVVYVDDFAYGLQYQDDGTDFDDHMMYGLISTINNENRVMAISINEEMMYALGGEYDLDLIFKSIKLAVKRPFSDYDDYIYDMVIDIWNNPDNGFYYYNKSSITKQLVRTIQGMVIGYLNKKIESLAKIKKKAYPDTQTYNMLVNRIHSILMNMGRDLPY